MSSEASRSTAATGKAYRALKELVRAALATLSYCPVAPGIARRGRATSSPAQVGFGSG